MILFFWRHEIDSLLDGIIYGAMVGMGFAMVENVFYFESVFAEGGTAAWQTNIFMRAVIFGLNHSLFTAVIGLGIAWAKMNPTSPLRYVTPVLGYALGMFLHFLHNFTVSFGNLLCLVALASDWGGVWLLVAIMIWALTQERRWIQEYLKEEVEAGILTDGQYETAISGRKRSMHHFQTLSKQGIRGYFKSVSFYHRCSELAYKKHHLELYHDDKTANEADELRKYIVESGPTFV